MAKAITFAILTILIAAMFIASGQVWAIGYTYPTLVVWGTSTAIAALPASFITSMVFN